jgi:hypothetical protein
MNTMGQILQNWRITLAAVFSAFLIVGAYMLARDAESPRSVNASPESALLQAIATKDTDGDGLTDWEEALYGTNPRVTDSFNLGMTDGEAVAKGLIVPKAIADISLATSTPISYDEYGLPPPPAEGTLTAAFAKNFFTLYLSVKESKGGANLTESEMANIANEAVNMLSSEIIAAPDYKSVKDLKISGSGRDALIEFAVNAEAVLLKNKSTGKKSEILYLQDAVQNNDQEALAHIASIAKGYRDAAVGLSALNVPPELVEVHLALINSMMRISSISNDLSRVNTDPLASILALKQYAQAITSLWTAFSSIGKIYADVGISIPDGASGALFVNLIEDMEKQTGGKKI